MVVEVEVRWKIDDARIKEKGGCGREDGRRMVCLFVLYRRPKCPGGCQAVRTVSVCVAAEVSGCLTHRSASTLRGPWELFCGAGYSMEGTCWWSSLLSSHLDVMPSQEGDALAVKKMMPCWARPAERKCPGGQGREKPRILLRALRCGAARGVVWRCDDVSFFASPVFSKLCLGPQRLFGTRADVARATTGPHSLQPTGPLPGTACSCCRCCPAGPCRVSELPQCPHPSPSPCSRPPRMGPDPPEHSDPARVDVVRLACGVHGTCIAYGALHNTSEALRLCTAASTLDGWPVRPFFHLVEL